MDILFINVPQISLVYPPAATSLLKGICEHHGYTALVRDYNLKLYNECQDQTISSELDQYFSLNDENQSLSVLSENYLKNYYNLVINDIIALNPQWLGISVFTFQCQIFTKQLLLKLRPVFKNKIVIGGAGISSNGIAANQNDFGRFLLENQLIDFYIRGEADINIINLLKENYDVNGINNDNMTQVSDLDSVPMPNYDDVIGLKYRYTTPTPQIPITGSRGCVRKCSFCDIHVAWPKYRYRSGRSIANELIHHYEKYKTTNFWFTDSLINGSSKSFRELYSALLTYYRDHDLPDKFFSWGGQFIVRNKSVLTEHDYESAAASGMNGVALGIESLSENVRDHMKKGFSNADLNYTLEQMHKNNMNCYFLMIVGYPTETLQDFTDGIDQFKIYQKYALDGTIYGVNLGTTASIDEGTPLFQEFHDLEHSDSSKLGFNWTYPVNPDLTLYERIRRRIVLQETLMDLGYKIWNGDSQLIKLKESYTKINNGNYKTKVNLPISE
jgi:hypothetical protein